MESPVELKHYINMLPLMIHLILTKFIQMYLNFIFVLQLKIMNSQCPIQHGMLPHSAHIFCHGHLNTQLLAFCFILISQSCTFTPQSVGF